jgi:hypothetical protein
MIEITGVSRFGPDAYSVIGQVRNVARAVTVFESQLAGAIGSDPAAHELVDLVPAIVELALPRLKEAFK